MIHKYLFLLFSILFSFIDAKILIFTTVGNSSRIDFLEMQAKTFKKFIKNDYQYVLFNDATNLEASKRIEKECEKWGIRCINVPQNIHKPRIWGGPFEYLSSEDSIKSGLAIPFRHANTIQYAFETLAFNHNDLVMVVDTDLFLIRDLDVYNFLDKNQMYGHNTRCPYPKLACSFVPEVLIFDVQKLPNVKSMCFQCGLIGYDFIDTLGFLQFYLHYNPGVKIKKAEAQFMKHMHAPNMHKLINDGYTRHTAKFIMNYLGAYKKGNENDKLYDGACFYDKTFYHYCSSSREGYFSREFFNAKNNRLKKFINKITR